MSTQEQGPVPEAVERPHLALRRAVVDVAVHLRRTGVLSHSGHANLSARVGPDTVTLAAVSQIRDLVPEHLAVVRLDGPVAEGDLAEMNSGIVATHTAVYRARPQVGAVVHTHSPNLLAFALAGRALPVRYEALFHLGQAEEVPVVPWAPGDPAGSVSTVIEVLKERPGTQAVLLGNHGVLALGRDAETAVSLLVVLEEAAQAELRAAMLGAASPFASYPGRRYGDRK